MSWLDILILLPLLIGLVRGLMKGLIVEVSSIVAILLGFFGAKYWSAAFASWLMQQFDWSETACIVVAYALLFAGIALGLNIVARLLSKLFQKIQLGWLNRLLGGIFGTAKWGIVIVALVLCVHNLDKQFQFIQPELREKSVVYTTITPYAEQAWEEIKAQVETQKVTDKEDSES
ncbi:MAG: CvpA family protein [Bacteroidales bacterium]|nr:CvpA family protein [Bacteroidales bacterium]MBR2486562.1 CvpA family protein [Paludibacteraceae bacterium]